MAFFTKNFVKYGLLASLVLVACKSRQTSTLQSVEDVGISLGFIEEIVPFNRLPISVIERDEKIFHDNAWPVPKIVQPIQVHHGVQYGIRIIKPEELAVFVRPGDIAVDYTPIDNPQNLALESKIYNAAQKSEGNKPSNTGVDVRHMILVGLGEKGMSHAKLVVKMGDSLCHVDSPEVMSDCKWEGFIHFFRVETREDVRREVLALADLMTSKPSAYDYDAFLYTDVYVKGISAVQRQIAQFQSNRSYSLPPLYCSELPFTIYALALGRNLFDTNFNLMDFATQIADLRSEPKFAPFISNELMQQSLAAFVQQASTVPAHMRPMLASGIKQLLTDGYVGSGMRYLVKSFYPPLVLPQHFMSAATDPERFPGPRVVYIGSMESPSIQKNRAYFSSLILETGRAAASNYLQRVRDWWNISSPKTGDSEFNLQLEDMESVSPNYLEPDYTL